jgi:hypothetical protein
MGAQFVFDRAIGDDSVQRLDHFDPDDQDEAHQQRHNRDI